MNKVFKWTMEHKTEILVPYPWSKKKNWYNSLKNINHFGLEAQINNRGYNLPAQGPGFNLQYHHNK